MIAYAIPAGWNAKLRYFGGYCTPLSHEAFVCDTNATQTRAHGINQSLWIYGDLFQTIHERSDPSCAHFLLYALFTNRSVDNVVQHDAIVRSDPCYRRVVDHGERACPRPRKRSSSSGGSRRTFPCNLFQITLWFLSGPERSRSST